MTDQAAEIRNGVNGMLKADGKNTVNERLPDTVNQGGVGDTGIKDKDKEAEVSDTEKEDKEATIGDTEENQSRGEDQNQDTEEPVTNHANKDNIGRLPRPKESTDWGHIDDEKFKIQDGDIIEYLMKEVILEGSAWAMNKLAGLVGVAAYEFARSGYNGIVKPGWNQVSQWWCDGWTKIWNNLMGGKAGAVPPPGGPAGGAGGAGGAALPAPVAGIASANYSNNSSDNFKLVTQKYEYMRDTYSALQGVGSGNSENVNKLYRKLAQGFVVWDEKEGKVQDLAGGAPYSLGISKECFEVLREDASNQLIAIFQDQLKEKTGKEYKKDDLQNLVAIIQDYAVKCQQAEDKGEEIPEGPKIPEPFAGKDAQKIIDAYDESVKKIQAKHPIIDEKNKDKIVDEKITALLFATHYAQYEMAEVYRKNPEKFGSVEKMQKMEKEYESAFKEGEKFFWNMEREARLKKEQMPSVGQMLKDMQDMAEKSTKLAEKGDKETPVENKFAALRNPQRPEKLTLRQAVAMQRDEKMKQERKALLDEESALNANEREYEGKRKICYHLRKEAGLRRSCNDNSLASEQTTKVINVGAHQPKEI